ncbi:ABC transporter substrate-binding protein [Rhizobiaceae bacterium BDR2-2]|uniref:ABC transporter substrate-binding protein n=1 Tax=Ectorhizobium quercum TaxID=2965071 RepID=A0AAE3MWE7_9HYPH|nr:ABC transporter substrate-binding protein [Ectorhizobium quercum]MCX8995536.1 ABC transporter substrate-binding protein [Ectorhizobium quercum]
MIRWLFLVPFLYLALAAQAQETRPFTDDTGRTVAVPARPARIASLHDIDITIPLVELGVVPAASHGRIGLDGKPYLRSGALLAGVDFDNSDMLYIGSTDIDIEALAEARPDLIVTATGRPTPVDILERIAPTVVLDATRLGAPHVYARLAELTGTQARLSVLERRYRSGIEALKRAVETDKVTVSVLQPLNGKVNTYHTYRSLGRVLRDAGFRFPALIDSIPEGGRIEISAERLPELDADFIFDPYRSDTGGTSAEEIAAMEKVLPGFCTFLRACREGRYVMVSREEAISNSYAALALMTAVVQASIAPRPAAP